MRISCKLLAISILSLMPLASMAQQDVVPYAKSSVKVDWVRGTDFSKYKTYAWGTSHLATPSLEHTVQGMIDAALQAKGLQKVGMDARYLAVLAAAALTLAKDPDPKSGEALANAATTQEKWLVRAAAFDAIARRGDPSLLHVAVAGLQDKQDEVQYSAAGAVLRLSDIEENRKAAPKPPAKGNPLPKKKQ